MDYCVLTCSISLLLVVVASSREETLTDTSHSFTKIAENHQPHAAKKRSALLHLDDIQPALPFHNDYRSHEMDTDSHEMDTDQEADLGDYTGFESETSPSKRGALFRFGKRQGSLFRFGKRGSLLRFGKRSGSLFRFGKRGGSLFRFGRSGPAAASLPIDMHQMKRTLFRFGKRSDDEILGDDEWSDQYGSWLRDLASRQEDGRVGLLRSSPELGDQ